MLNALLTGFFLGLSLIVAIGAQNAFDEYPDEEPRASVLGWKYPEQAPFGFNGAFYYMKLSMDL